MAYSIIIPVYNEYKTIEILLEGLESYHKQNHEIIIIDDGSTDKSLEVLKECTFIKLISLQKNSGKGFSIREGLNQSINNKTIIFDGDLELKISHISKLMLLNKQAGISSLMGFRFNSLSPFKSGFDWGNFIFTFFFNVLYRTRHKDILCCAKSFYKKDIPIKKIKSKSFDIDVELSAIMSINSRGKNIKQVFFNYSRRTTNEGKKLKIYDGWAILFRILKIAKFL